MEERVEEIRPISRICPVRKIALVRPRRGRRELMYQFNRYLKVQKPKRKKLVTKKIPDVSGINDSGTIFNSKDFIGDLKKRIAFDRAMIIGD